MFSTTGAADAAGNHRFCPANTEEKRGSERNVANVENRQRLFGKKSSAL